MQTFNMLQRQEQVRKLKFQDWVGKGKGKGSLEDLIRRCSTIQIQLVRCTKQVLHVQFEII